jgi:NitT/TauT family transport system substrate-binding protein
MQLMSRYANSSWGLVVAVAMLGVVAVACAPSPPPSPTAAPAKPPEAAKPAAAPSPAASPAASPSPAAKPAAITLPRPEQTSIKFGHATLENSTLGFVVANDLGFYRKYGIEKVEFFYNEGDAKAHQALVSGQMDVSSQGVGPAIASQIGDLHLVTTAMTSTILTDDLVAGPNIRTPADLKGKTVAISSFGGTAHGAVLLALKAIGLTTNDVTLVQVGGQSARIAAVKAGSVAAAPIDVALQAEMKQQGFNILVSLPDTPLEYGRSGLLMRREWMEKNPNTVLALVAGALEGQNAIWTQTESAIDSFAKWTQTTDRSKAEVQVKEFLKTGRRDMRWSKEGWELARDVLATENPAIARVDVTKAYELKFLDQLRQMGLNDMIGVPKT